MRKGLNTIVTVLMVLALSMTSISALEKDVVNVIKDGDFEQGGTAWTLRNKGEVQNKITYDGNYAGVVPNTAISGNFANGFIGQVIKLEPNTKYHVSAYAKVDVKGADAIFTGRFWSNNEQGAVITLDNGQTVDQAVTSTEWQKVSYTFNSGTHEEALIQLVKWSEKEETKQSNAYIDQVLVTRETLPQADQPKQVFTEVWRDDFDQETLNMEDWDYELGSIRGIEQQHYVNNPENVFIRDGNLVLRATDRDVDDQYLHPRDASRNVIYNSGSIRTHGKREFLYGKLEIRAKLPKGRGAFPAFWTLGADFTLDGKIKSEQGRGWPSTGEIDIMELIGEDRDGTHGNRTVYQTVHYGPTEDHVGRFSGNGTAHTIPQGNFNDEFHTFALNWTEDALEWFVDDEIVRTVPYGQDPIAKEIFNKPQYIQLNLAMGGAWPGPVGENLSGTEFVIDSVSYQQTEAQAQAAQVYYARAPKLDGVKPLSMMQGGSLNPLEGITTIEGYDLDFSIEDTPMFNPSGGNSNVRLLVQGMDEAALISELPEGTYNIHYSATPQGIDLTQDMSTPVARQATTLLISKQVFPDAYKLKIEKGQALASLALPTGWTWKTPETLVQEAGMFTVIFGVHQDEHSVPVTIQEAVGTPIEVGAPSEVLSEKKIKEINQKEMNQKEKTLPNTGQYTSSFAMVSALLLTCIGYVIMRLNKESKENE